MDKLEAMQVYVCVVDTHSFIRAAEVLGVPRSTVSRVVKELESWLKIQLLQRTTRKLSVTAEGRRYYEECKRLANFCETVRITPMVNQVELHPYFAQPAALETMKHYNVQPEAWAPLGGGRHKPYENEMLERIADAHQKTIAQVVLRWNVQRGVTVIPKSTRQERIEENFAIWDFSLTDNEMAQINALDLGYVGEAVKHFNPEFVRGCLGVKIHD